MLSLKNMVQGLRNDVPAQKMIQFWKHDAETLKFWRASSNFVYQFQMDGKLYFLRFIHDEDHSSGSIQAELDYILYLLNRGYAAAAPVRSINGNWIESISTDTGLYHGVVFEQARGVHIPIEQMTERQLREWGQSLASLHLLSEEYIPAESRRIGWLEALDFVASVLQRYPYEYGAIKACGELKGWLAELPSGAGHTGLIHFDFEPDNVFYMEEQAQFSAIDFDDSMYHWFMMDITAAIADLTKSNDDEAQLKVLQFIDGYKSVKHLDDEYMERLPGFQKFADLYSLARVLHCVENMDILELPEWSVKLKQKLLTYCDQLRIGFQPEIRLEKINESNWDACSELRVTGEQQKVFPVSSIYWLAESAYCGFTPLALFAGDALIGLTVYAVDPEDESYWIMAYMIDEKFQGKGYGRAGMNAVIRYIREKYSCERIVLAHRLENEAASRLYASLGFREAQRNAREVIRHLDFN